MFVRRFTFDKKPSPYSAILHQMDVEGKTIGAIIRLSRLRLTRRDAIIHARKGRVTYGTLCDLKGSEDFCLCWRALSFLSYDQWLLCFDCFFFSLLVPARHHWTRHVRYISEAFRFGVLMVGRHSSRRFRIRDSGHFFGRLSLGATQPSIRCDTRRQSFQHNRLFSRGNPSCDVFVVAST